MRFVFLDRNKTKTTAPFSFIIALMLGAVYLSIYLGPTLIKLVPKEIDLDGVWDVCTNVTSDDLHDVELIRKNCKWNQSRVNTRLYDFRPEYSIYRSFFPTPSKCIAGNQSCVLIIGKVFHSAEVLINGHSIGKHGGFPDTEFYSGLYPLSLTIPNQYFSADHSNNEIIVKVHSLKGSVQTKTIFAPIAIYQQNNSLRVTEALIGEIVLLPIIGAIGIAIFAVIGLIISFSSPSMSKVLSAYVWWCLSCVVFLISLSRLPKVWLPFQFAYNLHFFSRMLVETTFFVLISSVFPFKAIHYWIVKSVFLLVGLTYFLLICVCFYLGMNGFNLLFATYSYSLAKFLLVFSLLPLAIAILGTYQNGRFNNYRALLRCLFSLLILFNVFDISEFFELTNRASERYSARIYPFFVALTLGYIIWSEKVSEERRSEVDSAIGTLVSQVAHDIRSPLAALKVFQKHCLSIPENDRAILIAAIDRVEGIASNLLKSRSALKQKKSPLIENEQIKLQRIDCLLSLIVREKKIALEGLKSMELIVNIDESAAYVASYVHKSDFMRAISNLLNNAIDSIPADKSGRIVVRLDIKDGRAEISISDNGTGLSKDKLNRFNQYQFGETDKENGTGLGLSQVWQMVELHGGTLRFDNNKSTGCCVTIGLSYQAYA